MALILAAGSNLYAQDAKKNVYLEIACFKSNAPGASKLFTEFAKPFHEELIRQGVLVGWAFYKVDFPNGSDCNCEFREVRAFTDIKSMDILSSDAFTMEVAQKVFPDQNLEELMVMFREKVEFKNSQIYALEDELVPGPSKSHMLVVNFMDVKQGMDSEYEKMEKEVFKPVHEASRKAGKLVDWSMWERVIPYGADFDHDYLTIDVWGSYENMADQDMGAFWKEIHPDMKPGEAFAKMDEIRDLRRAEVWISVVRADAPKTQEASSSNK